MVAVLFVCKPKRSLSLDVKIFKTNFQKWRLLYSSSRVPLLERMDKFISVCPNEKPASCLERFRKFPVKELQEILKHYRENILGKKVDHLMKIFTIFCRFQPKLQTQQLPSDSFMDHTICFTYKVAFSRELSKCSMEK